MNAADPATAPDIVALGATFTLNIQPSGQYTAQITLNGVSRAEIGELSVDGPTLTLTMRVLQPCCRTDRSAYRVDAAELRLEGPTRFDFNLDGTPEDATATIRLVRSD